MSTIATELPLFQCDRAEQSPDYPGALIVSFKCPACRRRHYHGWNKTDPGRPQHRASHCSRPGSHPGGYFIQLARKASAR